MHDLHTINKLNAQACERAREATPVGSFTVAHKDGVTVTDTRSFPTLKEATDFIAGANPLAGETRQLLSN